jgi:hypothetical protein
MAKKAKNFTEGDDLNDMAAEFLRGQKGLDKLTQKELDRLFKLAVQDRDPSAIRDLKELLAEGKAHVPVGGSAPVLGPAPAEVRAAAPLKQEGKATAKGGKSAGAPLPGSAGPSEVERRAQELEAMKSAERTKTQEPASEPKEAETLAESPKGKARGARPEERPKSTEPMIVPPVPELAAKANVAEMGAEKAQEFRERAARLGVNADQVLKDTRTGIKQLDQLPDNLATQKYLDRWLEAQAQSPGAKAAVKMMETREKREAAKTPAERKEQEKKAAAERGAARAEKRRAVGQGGVVTADELLKKNFAEQSSERFKSIKDKMVQNRIIVSAVDRKKAAEMTAVDDALEALETGRPKTPLADELAGARKQLMEATTPQQQRAAMSRLVAMHPRFMTKGKLKSGVLDLERTGEVVRARIKEEQIQARGAFVDTSDPGQFNAKKRALFSDLRRTTGAKSLGDLKAVIKEQGIDVDLSRAKSQKDVLKLMREEDVKKLEAFVATKREGQTQQAREIKSGKRRTGKAVETTKAKAGAVEMPPIEEDEYRTKAGAVKMPPIAEGERLKPFSTERANNLRKVLKEKGLTEEGLLKQINKASPKGVTYTRIEDLPQGLDKRINDWVNKAVATRPVPPTGKAAKGAKGAKAAKASEGAVKMPPITPAAEPPKVAAPAPAGTVTPGATGSTGAAPGPVTAGGLPVPRPSVPPPPVSRPPVSPPPPPPPGGGGLPDVPPVGRFGSLARVLGPIGIAFGVYEILSRLKGQTVDRADEDRLRVMEALGSMSRGAQEEGGARDALGQQGLMVGMAGLQRQRDLDAMRRVYTENADMNRLIRSNEDLLASIAMPSQPSVAELMARI